jgi:hypothetical protein
MNYMLSHYYLAKDEINEQASSQALIELPFGALKTIISNSSQIRYNYKIV